VALSGAGEALEK